jgi:hypothetical protein
MKTKGVTSDVRIELNEHRGAVEHWLLEINRWIARWENEGGAIVE